MGNQEGAVGRKDGRNVSRLCAVSSLVDLLVGVGVGVSVNVPVALLAGDVLVEHLVDGLDDGVGVHGLVDGVFLLDRRWLFLDRGWRRRGRWRRLRA